MLEFFYESNLIIIINILLKIIVLVVPLLGIVAFLTYAERKVIASVQLRKGPNVVGPFGLLQPLADGLKLFSKESIFPTLANKIVFILAPMVAFALSIAAWAVIPVADGWVISNINVGIEHGNVEFRAKYLNRKMPNEVITEGMKIVLKAEIPFSVNNILGFPHETREIAFDSIRLNRTFVDPKIVDVNAYPFTPFAGTPLRTTCENLGFIKKTHVILFKLFMHVR